MNSKPNSQSDSQEQKEAAVAFDEVEQQSIIDLEGRQRRLYEELSRRSADLASMYIGALQVVQLPTVEDRFAMAAHCLRELMEKLPQFLDVPFERDDFNLGNEAKTLHDELKCVKEQSESFVEGNWTGEVDTHIHQFLKQVDSVLQDHVTYNSRRRDQFRDWNQALDPSITKVPPDATKRMFREWKSLNDFFQRVSHHHDWLEKEAAFEEEMRALEDFLLDRFRPQTYKKQKRIDQIIAEAEGYD